MEDNFSFEKKETQKQEFLEIEKLKERIQEIESEVKKAKPESREKIIKQEIRKYLEELQETPSFASPTNVRDEAKEILKFPPSEQVGALISLVFEKGLKEAISVARHLQNPAILDEFHDTLVDQFYEKLVKEKIIKPL
jgi:seryl-tRNA synthetase